MKDNRFTPFDEIDWRISQELRKDARMSASEIARNLDLNQRTVRNRIEKMVELGAAKAYWVFEPDAFGYGISVDIFLAIDSTNSEEIYAELLSQPRISYLAYDISRKNLSIEARFKSLKEMNDFIHIDLPAIGGLTVENVILVPHIMKSITEWVPDESNFKLSKREDG